MVICYQSESVKLYLVEFHPLIQNSGSLN